MFCESPNYGFPCGKCRACKLRKANEKMLLSVFAAYEYKKKGQFLTLTFNDDYRPDGLDHTIFQGFMKRLRRADGTPDVKYFMAGEYGESEGHTHREHFHILFYNHKYDMDLVDRAWSDPKTGKSFGFTYDGTLTPQSMKYVSGYVDKKGYDPESGKKPPYGRSSCNIPDGLTDEEIAKMCLCGQIPYNGRLFSVPHRWRKRYEEIWRAAKSTRDEKIRERAETSKQWDPKVVSALMDQRDAFMAVRKARREKKRLQRKYGKRIM